MSIEVVVTDAGRQAFAAAATGQGAPVVFTTLAVGNGYISNQGYVVVTPDPTQTTLVHQRDQVPVTSVVVEGDVIRISAVVPADRGDYWISEIGFIDADGHLLVLASVTPFQKVALNDGVQDIVFTVPIRLANASNVVIQTDPSAVHVTYADLIEATKGGVKWVHHGTAVIPAGEPQVVVTLSPPIPRNQSFLVFSTDQFTSDYFGNASVRGAFESDTRLVFSRHSVATPAPATVNYQIVEHGPTITGPGEPQTQAPETTGLKVIQFEDAGHVHTLEANGKTLRLNLADDPNASLQVRSNAGHQLLKILGSGALATHIFQGTPTVGMVPDPGLAQWAVEGGKLLVLVKEASGSVLKFTVADGPEVINP